MTPADHAVVLDAYAAIRALRTDNTEGDLFLLQGVDAGHKAIDILG